jgi:ribosomal protein L11 methyltransferase
VTIEAGSFERATGVYDVVVANILAGVIIKMLASGLAQYGRLFIFSGILDTQMSEVSAAIAQSGLELIEHKQIADWVCLISRSG